MALICAPENRFACRDSVALRELHEQPFIAFADDIPTRRLIDAQLKAAGAQVRTVMAFENIETIKNLVEIGSGVALVPEETARKEAREGTLAVVPLDAKDAFERPSGLLVKKTGSRRAAVIAFLGAMTEEKGEKTEKVEKVEKNRKQKNRKQKLWRLRRISRPGRNRAVCEGVFLPSAGRLAERLIDSAFHGPVSSYASFLFFLQFAVMEKTRSLRHSGR